MSYSDEEMTEEVTSDADLIATARGGDQVAFAELWARHERAARTIASRIDRVNAEDIVAEAFTLVWEQLLRNGGPRSSFRAYMFTVVRNLAARWNKNLPLSLGDDIQRFDLLTHPSSEEVFEVEEEGRSVLVAFKELPDSYQKVLLLRDVEGLSQKDAAEQLGVSANAVGLTTMRAREALATAWLGQHLLAARGSKCSRVIGLLPRYVRGTLRAQGALKVESHLVTCSDCRLKVSQLREANSGLAQRLVVAIVFVFGGATATSLGASDSASAASWEEVLDDIGKDEDSAAFAVFAMLVATGASVPVVRIGLIGALLLSVIIASALLASDGADHGGETTSAVVPAEPSQQAERSSEGSVVEHDDTADAADGGEVEQDESGSGDDSNGGGGQGDDGGPREAPPGDTDEVVALTARATGTPTTVPTLTGKATPNAVVVVALGAQRLQVRASDRGVWSADLSRMRLNFGSFKAAATQRVGGERIDSVDVPFELVRAGYVATEREPAAGAVAAVIDLSVAGMGGATVCIGSEGDEWRKLPLNDSGEATAVLRLRAGWSKEDLTYWYCDDDRSGPVAPLNLNLSWHSTP